MKQKETKHTAILTCGYESQEQFIYFSMGNAQKSIKLEPTLLDRSKRKKLKWHQPPKLQKVQKENGTKITSNIYHQNDITTSK